MKKIKFQLSYKNYHYSLKDLESKEVVFTTITFYSMYCFLKEKKFDFDTISLPRLTLSKFFRDFAYYDKENDNKL